MRCETARSTLVRAAAKLRLPDGRTVGQAVAAEAPRWEAADLAGRGTLLREIVHRYLPAAPEWLEHLVGESLNWWTAKDDPQTRVKKRAPKKYVGTFVTGRHTTSVVCSGPPVSMYRDPEGALRRIEMGDRTRPAGAERFVPQADPVEPPRPGGRPPAVVRPDDVVALAYYLWGGEGLTAVARRLKLSTRQGALERVRRAAELVGVDLTARKRRRPGRPRLSV